MKKLTFSIVTSLVGVGVGMFLPALHGADAPELGIQRAVELSWPSAAGEQYRIYRSVGDLDHFFPLVGPLAGDGGALSLYDTVEGAQEAYYKLHVVPETPSPTELLVLHEGFGAAVDAKDPDQIAAFFAEDTRFESPPRPEVMNREGLRGWFADLFSVFPDYADTAGLRLAGENIVIIEHVGEGTHLGDLDLGAMGIVPPTGVDVLMPHIGVFEFEGDQAIRFHVYTDFAGQLMQIGVIPTSELPPLVPSITLPDPVASALTPLEAVAAARAAWNAQDLAGYASQIETGADLFFAPMGMPVTREEIAALQELYWLAFPDLQSIPLRTVDMGDGWVVTELLWQGTHTGPYFGVPATGLPFQLRVVELSRVDTSGLITYSHFYWDNVTLLAQLGLL